VLKFPSIFVPLFSTPSNMTEPSNSNDSNSSTRDGLPKLEDADGVNNYGEWKTKAELQLLSWDLLKYVTGPESSPPIIPDLHPSFIQRGSDPADPTGALKLFRVHGNATERNHALDDAKPWMTQNNTALSKIVNAVPKSQMHAVKGIIYAREAWNNLRDLYQPLNSMLAEVSLGDLHSYRCTPTMDVSVWLNDLQGLYQSLIDMDPHACSDRAFTLIAIGNLPLSNPDWRSFAVGLRQRISMYDAVQPLPTPIRSKEFLAAIRQENLFRNRENPDVQAHIFTARTNDNSKRTRTNDQASGGPSKRARTTNQVTCTNPNCGRKGHTFSSCLTYGGGNEGGYTPEWRGPWNLHLPFAQRSTANNVRPSTFASSSKTSTTHAATCQAVPSPPTEHDSPEFEPLTEEKLQAFAFETQVDSGSVITTLPVIAGTSSKNDNCFYDSGANRHVFNDRTAFETYQTIRPLPVNGFGNDYSTTAVGSGSVRLRARHRDRVSSVLFTSVLHIPSARSNLISGPQLDNAGVVATLGHGRATLTHHGTNLISGAIENGMYRLDVTVIRPPSPVFPPLVQLSTQGDRSSSDFPTA
jgi:hypothetical protein